ncbi:hypothetical protein BN159_8375 [Streptomyces davaonensis JCM 4913]|uniref:DUF885 domain-containing protein n=1 Tax=Streptomyces davaonensis (strain DSM 101723 / JCM 4913 / KCC S-0913 / 768) TaxID=1214101 RepID=K4RFS3_STRDJ|nr:DUF885 domain-containing protein [Streptomyces davaonensis]CCK32753.1 hypothetical protein BN159_8375 [Streptomyces davaonensis JCM 4913]
MTHRAPVPAADTAALPRRIADCYVDELIGLDPVTATLMGVEEGAEALPDFSPAGQAARARLARRTLERLADAEALPGADSMRERRCARLLRERLTALLSMYEAGEGMREVNTIASPVQQVRTVFTLMPTESERDWELIGRRMRAVPAALEGYRAALAEGLERGLRGGPRQVDAVVAQLTQWVEGEDGGWFVGFASGDRPGQGPELAEAAAYATRGLAGLRDWLCGVYAPAVSGAPEVVGRERYARFSRLWTGADLDLDEAYTYGWSEFHRLLAEMRAEADRVLPGATSPWEALAWADEHGERVTGVAATHQWLQELMDEAIEALDGTHFELAERIKRVESCIAPEGSAAAPYYTQPSEDFSRPGRTWLPTLGRTTFAAHHLVSTWYHEGVPGHHLQRAQWLHVAGELSRYQTTVGRISANCEGWALYAERLMDELGFLRTAERRLGYLDQQMMRAVRVVVDIGMHLELAIPADSPFRPGERWSPELALEFFGRYSSRPKEYVESEVTRYLGWPAQAIGYKLGERAWLRGRTAAQRRHGTRFDAKAWHMAALSLGSLGLDDLVTELSTL